MAYVVKDRYEPPTPFQVGDFVRVCGYYYRNRLGIVTGFGNPTYSPQPSVRVKFSNHRKPITFPVSQLNRNQHIKT